jgi:hypothetical protein
VNGISTLKRVLCLSYGRLGVLLPLMFPLFASVRMQAQETRVLPAALQKRYEFHLQDASLETIAQSLMTNGHISLLIDGEPLRKRSNLDIQGTLAEALDRVADDFDYNWRTTKSGIVLLTKRFKNPEELPQLNLPEMRQMAKDIWQTMNSLPVDTDAAQAAPLLKALLTQLDKTQVDALKSGQVLHGSDLNPTQAQLLMQLTQCQVYAGSYQIASDFAVWTELLPASKLYAKSYSNLPPGSKSQIDVFVRAQDRRGKSLFKLIVPGSSDNQTEAQP